MRPPDILDSLVPPAFDATQASDVVRGLYRGLLGREVEAGALEHWARAMELSGDAAAVTNAIVNSDEYKGIAAEKARQRRAKAAVTQSAKALMASQPLTIVDVGAQKLETEDHVYSPFSKNGVPCHVVGFEPLKERILESTLRNPDANITLYPTFIGDGQSHLFHINSPDATSSLLPFNTHLTSKLVGLRELQTVSTEQVATQTLDLTLANVERIDFLKLDIQGFELTALQHATSVLTRTNVVHCEVSFAEIYQGQALFSEVEQLLRQAGFYFVDLSTICRYPYHCQSNAASADRLGWGDAVFFKQVELLQSPRDLLAQALAAVLVYEKFSLAQALLESSASSEYLDLARLFGAH